MCCLVSGGDAGLVSIYKLVPNPNHTDPQHRAGRFDKAALKCLTQPRVTCPLELQLVTHIALENLSGVVRANSMANW